MKLQHIPDRAKRHGIQYTPPELARFLAEQMLEWDPSSSSLISILDPACGEGGLLETFARCCSKTMRSRLILTGYEIDSDALASANRRLSHLDISKLYLHEADFLSIRGVGHPATPLLDAAEEETPTFDAIISNPPYVRTQTLGAERSQELARRFGISGKGDLSYAFVMAMSSVLKPEGILGLLTSNRFLTVKSGQSLRRLLSTQFLVRRVYDLGDTKLFSAAVLPAIVIATKGAGSPTDSTFDRIYEHRKENMTEVASLAPRSILSTLADRTCEGLIRTPERTFHIERGTLRTCSHGNTWALATTSTDAWLAHLQSHQATTFGEMANVKVGIKTTADNVFLRNDWNSLSENQRPEQRLLCPLITHVEAGRWRSIDADQAKRVLYPHEVHEGKRRAVEILDYPNAARYLETHRPQLERRQYVIKSGRKWYEIWVPHNPLDWTKPKIVWPDISEEARFFMDESGAIVNGDCYWMTLKENSTIPDGLFLMLAVANSTLALRFYDIVFHNKLYSGRRRFMTQYVSAFPLPDLRTRLAARIVAKTKQLVKQTDNRTRLEQQINQLVWQSFGFAEET